MTVRLLLSLTPSGSGNADTVMITSPGEEMPSVRTAPDPLNTPPDTEYDAPLLTSDDVPEVSVPYAPTLSVWNSGDRLAHA